MDPFGGTALPWGPLGPVSGPSLSVLVPFGTVRVGPYRRVDLLTSLCVKAFNEWMLVDLQFNSVSVVFVDLQFSGACLVSIQFSLW